MIDATTIRSRVFVGYLASLGAAICYGSVAVVGRKIVTEFAPPMVATSFSMMFGTVVVAMMFHGRLAADLTTAPHRAWLFASLAGCASAWGVSFWYLALNEAPVVLVAPVTGISPLVAIVLTHLFLKRLERVTWGTVLGALLVVGGVVLVTVGNQ